jgi:delta(3,5)-delta(2,4)-dienoyl-CoA isomerase
MAADVGTLQRLPRVIGSTSLVNELCFTARQVLAPEAKECGLVNRVFKDKDRYFHFIIPLLHMFK